ncbi:MAG: carbohydrate-binding protein [Armatimonadetes bacterium]|nr:carbohydrate-binding protein [Armatimonadota bacterium]
MNLTGMVIMMSALATAALLSSSISPDATASPRTIFVSKKGSDKNPGTEEKPLLTISAAADMAQAGDRILVKAGIYRENVAPPRGGTSPQARITYEAAKGEKVHIKGSEVIKGWRSLGGGVWKVEIPNTLFGAFNPFADEVRGDWFDPRGRKHHTGAVYLNGDWLTEARSVAEVTAKEAPSWVHRLTEGYLLNVASIRAAESVTPAQSFTPSNGPRLAETNDGGQCLGWIQDGHGALAEVDFGQGSTSLELRVASETMGGEIEVRLGGEKGRQLGTLMVPNTGSWQSWQNLKLPIRRTSGTQKVWLAFKGPRRLNTNDNLWFARVGAEKTEVWAKFGTKDPNREEVEVNVRQTVFYPSEPGINYITVRGFEMSQAASNWAPPTAEQKAIIGTHWSKGWIIEGNKVHHSVCAGIALGKYGDEFDNTSADTAEGYVETINRAHAFRIPWTKDRIGHHIVRRNHVWSCEQVGIVGSLGVSFSEITDNLVHDIHTRMYFHGAEVAGIKFHGAIDTLIARNRVYRTYQGLWLDWMTQGTQVSQNLFHDNLTVDIWFEVNHGPFIVDRNALMSHTSIRDWSQGGAFVANLFGGRMEVRDELGRSTPFMKPHTTEVAGMSVTYSGDHRFVGNVFLNHGLSSYDSMPQTLYAVGNHYLGSATVSKQDKEAKAGYGEAKFKISSRGVKVSGAGWDKVKTLTSPEIKKGSLPEPLISVYPYANFDGSPWTLAPQKYGDLFAPNLLVR